MLQISAKIKTRISALCPTTLSTIQRVLSPFLFIDNRLSQLEQVITLGLHLSQTLSEVDKTGSHSLALVTNITAT